MKIKTSLVACLMICVLFAQSVSAQILGTSISSETVAVGDEIVFSVKADAQKVSGVQFDIVYDSGVLAYADSVKSELFDNAIASGINYDNPGSIGVLLGFVEEQKINGEILKVVFKVKDYSGQSKIEVNNIKLVVDKEKVLEDAIVVEFKINAVETPEKPPEETPEETPEDGSNNNSSSGSSSGSNRKPTQSDSSSTQNITQEITNTNSNLTDENVKTAELKDISGHWAEESIKYMVSQGVVNGFGDSTFAPDKSVTRAEFATMISKALALSEITENVYLDVSDDAWYKDTVLKCTKAGLIKGDSGNFRPADLISREEMTVIVYRAKAYLGLDNEKKENIKTAFVDSGEISDWAKSAVEAMVNDGIINGMSDNSFAPKQSATRAQAVVVLEKLLKLK